MVRLETPEAITSTLVRRNDEAPTLYYPLAEQQGFSLAVCAIPGPDIRQKIHEVAQRIRQEFPDQIYAPASYFHVTIATLGTVATTQEVAQKHTEYDSLLRHISSNTSRINILLEGIGHFPNCFFAQVFDETEALDTLHQSLMDTCRAPAASPFVPHITMGYSRGNAYALNKYINRELPQIRLGTDSIDTIHFTALDSRRSIYDTPFKIVDSYAFGD